ncbi:MAG TPA: GntG family PLP-dependent aldolase [Candidatus Limnocylindria bacterium]|nr:GntG family PLP-dependent aldolase [Candidatus Limnocylindria bacterium]
MDVIDLRSDTVTRPSAAMRRAMAEAEVGDDQYGEDPSVNRLQAEAAELLGKDSALLLPSGTMANQVALRTLTHSGDDVLAPHEPHIIFHETGAAAANAGVQLRFIGGRDGRFTADEFAAACIPRGHLTSPPTTLVVIENTHNRAGGTIFPLTDVSAVSAAARDRGVATYCDGARLLNAAVATGRPPAELAAPFDLVAISLSKGLGAPFGSLLAGSRELIASATRHRRMLGGALRQIGILAAAGSVALQHNLGRLVDDHAAARAIADVLAGSPAIALEPGNVETNIVVFGLTDAAGVPDAAAFVDGCRQRDVLLFAFGPRMLRAVTHLDVSREQCLAAAERMVAVAEGR